jgi:hypothetical protein
MCTISVVVGAPPEPVTKCGISVAVAVESDPITGYASSVMVLVIPSRPVTTCEIWVVPTIPPMKGAVVSASVVPVSPDVDSVYGRVETGSVVLLPPIGLTVPVASIACVVLAVDVSPMLPVDVVLEVLLLVIEASELVLESPPEEEPLEEAEMLELVSLSEVVALVGITGVALLCVTLVEDPDTGAAEGPDEEAEGTSFEEAGEEDNSVEVATEEGTCEVAIPEEVLPVD